VFIAVSASIQKGYVQRCKSCRKVWQRSVHLDDLVGQKFDQLVVIADTGKTERGGHIIWRVAWSGGF
jgi:hypothetical protein